MIETITIDSFGEALEMVIITHDDGSTTSMPKAIYDTLVSNSSTPQAGN